MKKILVIGELNEALDQVVSHAIEKSNYMFEYFTSKQTNGIAIDDENYLNLIQSAVERNDITVYSKLDSEICLKMILAAMSLSNNKHLIMIKTFLNADKFLSNERLKSLLNVSGMYYAILEFKSDVINDQILINIFQNSHIFNNLSLNQEQLLNICLGLFDDMESPLDKDMLE